MFEFNKNDLILIFSALTFLLLVIFAKNNFLFFQKINLEKNHYSDSLARNHLTSSFKKTKVFSEKINLFPFLTPTPISTPTPSLTPEPTEPPLVGFCLNVPILMYHHIQPMSIAKEKGQTGFTVDSGVFDQQIAYLTSHGYTTLKANDLVNALRSKTQLPSKSILITFDDGYKDIYDYAYPIFQKYGVKANLMIPSGLVGGADYLSWGQIEEMGRSGLIYYTDHTWSHYAVNNGSLDKIKYEIETSRQLLEQHSGQKIDIFTYPYGSSGSKAMQVLQEDGFQAAFSTIPGFWQCDSFIMNLHRNRIGNASLASYRL